MINKSEIRSIVSTSAMTEISAADEAELVIDSLTLLTLQHLLEERYGLVIEMTADDMRYFTSINGIYAYLSKNFPEEVAGHVARSEATQLPGK